MESNKENQEHEAASVSVASPRISSVGAPSEERGGGDHAYHSGHQGYVQTTGLDHLHWGGVGHRLAHDARSVASSAAADRDDKSIYEDMGALDATEEGREEEHDEDAEEDEDEEAVEEINLAQAGQGELREVPLPQLRHEHSNVDSTFTGLSTAGSLADVVDQLADQAVAGELSPRQAAAAIRSATARGAAGGDASSGGSAAAGDTADGSDSLSASGAHGGSSIAPSFDEGWQPQGGSSTADFAMESVPLDAEAAPPSATAASEADGQAGEASAASKEETPVGEVGEEATAADAAGEAEVPAAGHGAEMEEEAAAQPDAVLPASSSAREVGSPPPEPEEAVALPVEPAATAEPAAAPEAVAAAPEEGNAEEEEGTAGPTSPVRAAAAAAAAAAAGGAARRTASSNYRSRLMQQLTADGGGGEEEDITVYSSAAAAAAVTPAATEQPEVQQQVTAPAAAAAPAAAPAAAAASGSGGGMQPLSIANGDGKSGVMSTADTAKALAAINASAGTDEAAAPAPGLLFPQQWYQTFKGLLYMDGVDSLGRPVVVLNADACPPNMKASALVYIKAHLEPLVNQGDYVLVFTSKGAAKLPSMWIMGAYRSLPRPFRKHVQYIVLVRPSAFLRTVLAFMRPFVSRKAHRKIRQVQSVHEISAATEGEVSLQSLGPAFLAEHGRAEAAAAAAAAPQSP